MNNNQLIEYVNTERTRGVQDDLIKSELLSKGWSEPDVLSALSGIDSSVPGGPRSFSFSNMYAGRLGRWDYFVTGFGLSIILFVILYGISFVLSGLHLGGLETLWLVIVITFAMIIVTLPLSISLSVRRLHDLNWSGWFILLFLVPFVNFILSILLLFLKGTDSPNSHGQIAEARSFIRNLFNT